MKHKFIFSIFLLGFLITTISATQVCETYDDFSSGNLDTSKWEVRQDVEGQPYMEEYWVDSVLENFHTQQNSVADRRVYLFPKKTFTTGDIIKYDVDLVSHKGNYGNMVLLTGDQYYRIGIIGYNNGGDPAVNEIGTYNITLEFQENNLALLRETPSGIIFLDNLTLTNINGNYELYIGSFSGHNGITHMDYDNFKICTEEQEPTLEEKVEILEQKVQELESQQQEQDEKINELENKTSKMQKTIKKIVAFIKKLPKGLRKYWKY